MWVLSCGILREHPNFCPKCQGMGQVHKPCFVCNSTGRCHLCNGSGFIKCPYCTNGAKFVDKKWQRCEVCQGKGNQWKSCHLCGSGSLMGSGICQICRSQFIKCIYCDGSGHKIETPF